MYFLSYILQVRPGLTCLPWLHISVWKSLQSTSEKVVKRYASTRHLPFCGSKTDVLVLKYNNRHVITAFENLEQALFLFHGKIKHSCRNISAKCVKITKKQTLQLSEVEAGFFPKWSFPAESRDATELWAFDRRRPQREFSLTLRP